MNRTMNRQARIINWAFCFSIVCHCTSKKRCIANKKRKSTQFKRRLLLTVSNKIRAPVTQHEQKRPLRLMWPFWGNPIV
jgi:hypothetical protein